LAIRSGCKWQERHISVPLLSLCAINQISLATTRQVEVYSDEINRIKNWVVNGKSDTSLCRSNYLCD
jgi:hypothetical protein